MSAVTLLCADHPLPLYESGSRWTETSSHGPFGPTSTTARRWRSWTWT